MLLYQFLLVVFEQNKFRKALGNFSHHVFENASDQSKKYGGYERDGATLRAGSNSGVALRYIFRDQMINRFLWAVRSSYLTLCESFLW
jgi:hypothetical protein